MIELALILWQLDEMLDQGMISDYRYEVRPDKVYVWITPTKSIEYVTINLKVNHE